MPVRAPLDPSYFSDGSRPRFSGRRHDTSPNAVGRAIALASVAPTLLSPLLARAMPSSSRYRALIRFQTFGSCA